MSVSAWMPARLLCVFLLGCASQATKTPTNADAPAPEPVAAPEPAPAPEPPPPPPEPEPVVAPDGTVIVDCEEAPAGTSCVPGGPFVRGSDDPHPCEQQGGSIPDKPNFRPAAEVWTQTFYMDITEVTYGAYQACVKEGKCNRAGPSYSDYDRPNQPMVGMSWYDTVKFCKANGKHLPTEAEWEKAARGPEGYAHPWGNEEITCERAVIRDESGRSCGIKKQGGQADKGRTWEVAQKPVGAYGLYDMIGNAEEWTADWYSRSYESCGEACLGVNPKGPCDGKEPCKGYQLKSVKGGSWYWPGSHGTGFHRRPHFPSNKPYHHYGFRCAASLEEARALVTAQKEAEEAAKQAEEAAKPAAEQATPAAEPSGDAPAPN